MNARATRNGAAPSPHRNRVVGLPGAGRGAPVRLARIAPNPLEKLQKPAG